MINLLDGERPREPGEDSIDFWRPVPGPSAPSGSMARSQDLRVLDLGSPRQACMMDRAVKKMAFPHACHATLATVIVCEK